MTLTEFQRITVPIPRTEILDVLALAVGYPTPEKLDRLLAFYSSPSGRLFVLLGQDEVRGIVGIEFPMPGRVRIVHIAVPPPLQRRGIGRRILAEVMAMYPAAELTAETDKNAVGFYRACGFTVCSLGEKYPGVERFECVLKPGSFHTTPVA